MKKNRSDAELIQIAAADINSAFARMNATFEQRDASPSAYEEWKDACQSRPQSSVQFYDRIMRFLRTDTPDKDDRSFALQHVDVNPRFF